MDKAENGVHRRSSGHGCGGRREAERRAACSHGTCCRTSTGTSGRGAPRRASRRASRRAPRSTPRSALRGTSWSTAHRLSNNVPRGTVRRAPRNTPGSTLAGPYSTACSAASSGTSGSTYGSTSNTTTRASCGSYGTAADAYADERTRPARAHGSTFPRPAPWPETRVSGAPISRPRNARSVSGPNNATTNATGRRPDANANANGPRTDADGSDAEATPATDGGSGRRPNGRRRGS